MIRAFRLEILSQKPLTVRLNRPETALNYREKFSEILVDEYQDSNLVQEIIINMISGKGERTERVYGGDVKQSIYRFRQAKPSSFSEVQYVFNGKGSPSRKILYKNFRSRSEILDAVNFIFKQVMSVEAGEIDYTDAERLNCGAVFPGYDEKTLPEAKPNFTCLSAAAAATPLMTANTILMKKKG